MRIERRLCLGIVVVSTEHSQLRFVSRRNICHDCPGTVSLGKRLEALAHFANSSMVSGCCGTRKENIKRKMSNRFPIDHTNSSD